MGYVLEGPDGAGKSTLASYLSERLDYEVDHFGPPEKPPLEEYLHWLVDLDTQRRVIDRFHLGESVYGPIFRGSNGLTVPELCTIEWALMVRGYTLVHVTQSLNHLVSTIQHRGDDMVDIDHIVKVVERYWKVMQLSFMPRITYDYLNPTGYVELISDPHVLKDRSERYMRHMDLGYPGTGNLLPTLILVGDQTNPNLERLSRQVPFSCGTAGDWLIRAIWLNGWQSSVYVTNAKKASGDVLMVGREIRWLLDEAFLSQVRLPRVIALGDNASKILRSHGIEHEKIVHPSYHRRFAKKYGVDDYTDLLTHAAEKSLV